MEKSRLVRLYASNVLKPESITAVGEDLGKLSFASANQLADENLGLGDSTWAALSEMEEEFDTKPFYQAVLDFYVASWNKMLKKFPFGDTILKDLGIINPDMVCTSNFTTIQTLAKRFPQLELAESASIDALRGEFMDFKLSPTEHPTVEMYKSATGDDKPRPGRFWYEVGQRRSHFTCIYCHIIQGETAVYYLIN